MPAPHSHRGTLLVIEFFHFLGYTVLMLIVGAWWGIFWVGKK